MGIDLSKIAADLIKRVETAVNGENSANNNNRLEENEISIFKQEFAKEYDNRLKDSDASNDLSWSDVNEIMGFVKTTESQAKAPARVKQEGGTDVETNKNEDGVHVTVVNNNTWYVNINIEVNVAKELEALIKELMEVIDEKITSKFDELVAFLAENAKTNTDVVLAFIQKMYEQYNDKDQNVNDLMTVLNDIKALLEAQGVKIDDLNGMVQGLLNKSFEVMEIMKVNIQDLVALVKESVSNEEEQLKLLADLNQAILSFTENFSNYSAETRDQLNALIELAKSGNIKLDAALKLLNAIKDDTSENKKTGKAILNAVLKGNELSAQILSAIEVLGTNVVEGLGTIIAKIEAGDKHSEEMIKLLELTLAQAKENGEIAKENGEILNEGLNKILKAVGENTEVSKMILELVKELGEESLNKLALIYDQFAKIQGGTGGDTTVVVDFSKLEEMMAEMLELVKAGNEQDKTSYETLISGMGENNALIQKVLEAIEKYGPEILDAIAKNTAAINVLTEQVKANGDANKEGFQAVLNKLENLPLPIDVSSLEALLQDIKALTDKNGESLVNIIKNQDVIISILETFKQGVKDSNKTAADQRNTIIQHLNDLADRIQNGDCSCDVDDEKLMEMLQAILDAIQNQELVCKCECGSGDTSNEDIVEDLDNIFGVNARRETAVETEITRDNKSPGYVQTVLKPDNKYGLPTGLYFVDEAANVVKDLKGVVVYE